MIIIIINSVLINCYGVGVVLLERKDLKKSGVYSLLGLPKKNDHEKNVKEAALWTEGLIIFSKSLASRGGGG